MVFLVREEEVQTMKLEMKYFVATAWFGWGGLGERAEARRAGGGG
jgi:hypothetical protein